MANLGRSRPFATEVSCDSCTKRCLSSVKCRPVTMIDRSLFAPSQGPTENALTLYYHKALCIYSSVRNIASLYADTVEFIPRSPRYNILGVNRFLDESVLSPYLSISRTLRPSGNQISKSIICTPKTGCLRYTLPKSIVNLRYKLPFSSYSLPR